MRKSLAALVASAAVLGSSLLFVAPAHAAPESPVTIAEFGERTGAIDSTFTITPRYDASESVQVTSALLDVSRQGKSVTKNRKAVQFTFGTFVSSYDVTTKVKYREKNEDGSFGPTQTASDTSTLTVRPTYKECATEKGFDSVFFDNRPGKGNTLRGLAKILGKPSFSFRDTLKGAKTEAPADIRAEARKADKNGYNNATVVSAYSFAGCGDDNFFVYTLRGPKDKVDRAWLGGTFEKQQEEPVVIE